MGEKNAVVDGPYNQVQSTCTISKVFHSPESKLCPFFTIDSQDSVTIIGQRRAVCPHIPPLVHHFESYDVASTHHVDVCPDGCLTIIKISSKTLRAVSRDRRTLVVPFPGRLHRGKKTACNGSQKIDPLWLGTRFDNIFEHLFQKGRPVRLFPLSKLTFYLNLHFQILFSESLSSNLIGGHSIRVGKNVHVRSPCWV